VGVVISLLILNLNYYLLLLYGFFWKKQEKKEKSLSLFFICLFKRLTALIFCCYHCLIRQKTARRETASLF